MPDSGDGAAAVTPGAAVAADPAAPRVFISYAHEPDGHDERVRDLWIFLRSRGVDAVLDRPAAEYRQDWPLWMSAELRQADFVLVIASPAYKARAEGRASFDEGRGVQYEAALIREMLYQNRQAWFGRIIPVLLTGRSPQDVPDWLGPLTATTHQIDTIDDTGTERLLRLLLGQLYEIVPALGTRPSLPTREIVIPSSVGAPAATAGTAGRPLSPVRSAGPVTVPGRLEDPERGALLRALATAFYQPDSAIAVLEAAGLDLALQAQIGPHSALAAWTKNLRELEQGRVADPHRRIVREALRSYPNNEIFQAAAERLGISG